VIAREIYERFWEGASSHPPPKEVRIRQPKTDGFSSELERSRGSEQFAKMEGNRLPSGRQGTDHLQNITGIPEGHPRLFVKPNATRTG
jgi:hypothetical protein